MVLLKGAVTIVAAPSGEVFINTHTSHNLAAAGSGDVLSGLLGAMLARTFVGREPELADLAKVAACAAMVHGQAGLLGDVPGNQPGHRRSGARGRCLGRGFWVSHRRTLRRYD